MLDTYRKLWCTVVEENRIHWLADAGAWLAGWLARSTHTYTYVYACAPRKDKYSRFSVWLYGYRA